MTKKKQVKPVSESYHLLTPEERADILWYLKHGPKLEDRQSLADWMAHVYKQATGRDLKQNCDAMMEAWRKSQRGKCGPNQTYLY